MTIDGKETHFLVWSQIFCVPFWHDLTLYMYDIDCASKRTSIPGKEERTRLLLGAKKRGWRQSSCSTIDTTSTTTNTSLLDAAGSSGSSMEEGKGSEEIRKFQEAQPAPAPTSSSEQFCSIFVDVFNKNTHWGC